MIIRNKQKHTNGFMLMHGLMFLFLISSCAKEGSISMPGVATNNDSVVVNGSVTVTSVEVVNDRIIVRGNNLNATKHLQIKAAGLDKILTIQSKTSSELIAAVTSLPILSILPNQIFSLIISTANAQSVIPIQFVINNGTITGSKIATGTITGDKIAEKTIPLSKISASGASTGQVPMWDGTTWTPGTVSGGSGGGGITSLTFNNGFAGGPFTVTSPTAINVDTGNTANKIVKLDSAGDFLMPGLFQFSSGAALGFESGINEWRFFNSGGDLRFSQLDVGDNVLMTPFEIDATGDITMAEDVVVGKTLKVGAYTLPAADGANGEILKTNGAGVLAWSSAGGTGTVTNVSGSGSISVATGTSTPVVSISNTVATGTYTKLTVNAEGLVTNGANLSSGDIPTGIDATKIGAGGVTNTEFSYLDTITSNVQTQLTNKEGAISAGTTAQYFRGDKSWQTLDTLAVPENTNLYFTDSRAKSAAVADAINDGTTDVAPSQNAVFDALALKADSGTLGNYVDKTGDSMTGDLTMENQNAIRFGDADSSAYVTIRSAPNLAGNINFTLPIDDGISGQVLTTDGAGIMTWTTSTVGDITGVTAGTALTGGGTSGDVTLNVDVGTTNGQIAQVGAGNKLAVSIIPTGIDAANINTGVVSNTEYNYLDGVTSAIQTQLDGKEGTLTAGTSAQYYRGDKTWQTLDSAVVPENTNLYFTDTRARTAAVADAINDATTNIAPSQNAVFDALALKADDTDLANYVAKAGDSMTGNLGLNNEKEIRFYENSGNGTNYVALKAPATLAGDLTFNLPTGSGTAGQVLATNGAGQLSWTSPGGGGTVTNIATGTGLGGGPITGTGTISIVDGGVGSTQIANDSIVNADINSAANIDAGKLGTGVVSNTEFNYLDGVTAAIQTQLNGKEGTLTAGTSAQYYRGDKTWQTLDTSIVPENTNLYYTDLRARTAAVADAINDATTNVAPSQNAVFDALALKADDTDLANYVAKAGDTMSGLLRLQTSVVIEDPGAGGFAATIQSPTLAANYVLTLPVDDGTSGQLLQSDGAGVLSWVSGAAPTGAAGGDLSGTYPNPSIAAGVIVDADINASAAITATKIAGGSVDNTEFGYLDGATSSLQSQMTAKLNKAGDTMTGELSMNAQNMIKFKDSDSSNFVALRSPATVTTDRTFILPASYGTSGEILSTDGAGGLTWIPVVGGGGDITGVAAGTGLTGGGVAGDVTLNVDVGTTNGQIAQVGAGNKLAVAIIPTGIDAANINTGVVSNAEYNYLDGVTAAIQTQLNGKEGTLTAGTSAQYYRGDKTWQTLDTAVVPENTNLYFTDARARTAAVADAINDATTNIAPSQNAVFDALALKVNKAGDTMSGLLRLQTSLVVEDPTAGTKAVTIQTPAALAADYTLTLPVDDGNNAQVLTTNGTGTLSWSSPTGGTVTNIATGTGLGGGPITSTGTISIIDGGVGSTQIADNSIVDGDINSAAAIAWSKMANLTVDTAVYSNASGDVTSLATVSSTELGYLDGTTAAIQTQLNGKEGTITAGTSAQYYRGDKTWQTLNTTAVAEGTNLYFTNGRAQSAVISDDAITDATTTSAPSENAVFDALALKANTSALANYVAKAGDTMTGELSMNAQSMIKFKDSDSSNFVALRAPAAITTDVTWLLPAADGTSGQVLSTNGTGTLSWLSVSGGGGDITGVAAGTGLTGGGVAGDVTLNVDVGTGNGQIVQVGAGDKIAVSLIPTGIPAASIGAGSVDNTELGYLDGATSSLQTQIGTKVNKAGDTMTGNLYLDNQASVILGEADVNGVNTINLRAPAAFPTNYTLTLPTAVPGANSVLLSDAAGTFTWATGLPPNGSAGGDLTGTYPSPTIATSAVTSGKILDGTIIDTDINASAAITATKIAGGTVDNTEFAYLDGATSSLQTQLTGKVNKAGDTMTGELNMNAQNIVKYRDADSTNFAGLRAPATIATDFSLILPTALPGANGSALVSDTSGNLTYLTSLPPSGSAGGDLTGTYPNPSIAAGVIVDADINASAAITATKIAGGTVDNTEFGYLNGTTAAIQTQVDGKVNKVGDTMTGNLVAPIMYDYNNTAYYVDPASTSNINVLSVNGNLTLTGAGDQIFLNPASWNQGINIATAGSIYWTDTNALAGNQDIYIGTMANNLWVYDNSGAVYLQSWDAANDRVGIMNNAPAYTLDVTGTFRATSSIYTPIMYDSDNTGYYVNPNGTSNMSSVTATTFTGSLTGAASLNVLKTGDTMTGNFVAPIMYDYNNTGYYVDPASTSIMNDVRGNIFYDQGNTAYYLDPNGTSNLSSITATGNTDFTGVNHIGYKGLHGGYTAGDELWTVWSIGSSWTGAGGHGGAYTGMYGLGVCQVPGVGGCPAAATTGIGWMQFNVVNNGTANIALGLDGNAWFAGAVRAASSVYTPIMYDSDNTGYYVNPASTSIMNDVRGNIFYDQGNTAYYVDPASTSIMNDVRGHIFYDQGNTGYYIDPASSSVVNNLDVNGTLYAGCHYYQVSYAASAGNQWTSVTCDSGNAIAGTWYYASYGCYVNGWDGQYNTGFNTAGSHAIGNRWGYAFYCGSAGTVIVGAVCCRLGN